MLWPKRRPRRKKWKTFGCNWSRRPGRRLADYYLAVKATTVAEENAKLLSEFRKNAESRYKTGQGPQQDVLQADVEIARQEERLVSLRRRGWWR